MTWSAAGRSGLPLHAVLQRHHRRGAGRALGRRRRRSSTPRCVRAARRATARLRFVAAQPAGRRRRWPAWCWRSRACWRSPSTRRRSTSAFLALSLERRQGAPARGHPGAARRRALDGDPRPHRGARRWRLPSSAVGPRLTLLTLWVAPTLVASVICVARRRAAADRRPVAVVDRVRRRGAPGAPRRRLVSPRHDCGAHLRPVRHVPRAGGAALPVAELLRRARHRAPDHDLRRRGAEPLGDACSSG